MWSVAKAYPQLDEDTAAPCSTAPPFVQHPPPQHCTCLMKRDPSNHMDHTDEHRHGDAGRRLYICELAERWGTNGRGVAVGGGGVFSFPLKKGERDNNLVITIYRSFAPA